MCNIWVWLHFVNRASLQIWTQSSQYTLVAIWRRWYHVPVWSPPSQRRLFCSWESETRGRNRTSDQRSCQTSRARNRPDGMLPSFMFSPPVKLQKCWPSTSDPVVIVIIIIVIVIVFVIVVFVIFVFVIFVFVITGYHFTVWPTNGKMDGAGFFFFKIERKLNNI